MPGTPSPSDHHPVLRNIVAGCTVALILIPQSLAYADLAGMPPWYGLYASILPLIAAAFFASSPHLQTGPVAVTSLLTFGALAPLAAPGSATYIGLAALLALLVGVIRVLLGIVRAGWVAYLMSSPILNGFTAAAALLIILSQVPIALGTTPPSSELLLGAWWAAVHPAAWDPIPLGVTIATLAIVLGAPRIHPLLPGVLIALVAATLFSHLANYTGEIVGTIPTDLPTVSLALPWGSMRDLVLPALIIALIGFAEPAAIARTYATEERRAWDPDREFVSQGVANLAAGLSGAFPVGGSFSRTGVNRAAGGTSRWSGAVAGLAVAAVLPAAGLLAPLPRATLAAIVIASVLRLVNFRPLIRLVRLSPTQAAVAWTTFVLTLALAPHVERAVLIGILLAVGVHLWRDLKVQVDVSYRDGTLIFRPQGVLFFASAPGLDVALMRKLAEHPETACLRIDLGLLGRIDYTGALALASIVEGAEDIGLRVELVRIPPRARRLLAGVFQERPDLLDGPASHADHPVTS